MKKIIKDVDEKRGIVQATIADERWYFKDGKDPQTGNPIMTAVPSVTWIGSFYPKGVQYYKWLAEHGWDESQVIMREAGEKGVAALMRPPAKPGWVWVPQHVVPGYWRRQW